VGVCVDQARQQRPTCYIDRAVGGLTGSAHVYDPPIFDSDRCALERRAPGAVDHAGICKDRRKLAEAQKQTLT
jgi:hypothetical protein